MLGSPQSASSPRRASRRPTLWLFDMILGVLLALLLVPPVVALSSLPWNDGIPVWTLPLACAIGFALGALGSLLPLSKRSTLAQLVAAPILGGALAAGGTLGASAASAAHLSAANTLGLTLLGGYTALLGALVPWLFFRLEQPWLGMVVAWLTVAGVWRGGIGLRQVWWVLILLALSLLILGLRRLREETAIWLRDDLQRLGAVFWPSARAILAITLLVTTVGLVPLAAQLGILSDLWNHTPLGKTNSLPFDSPQGTPAAALGAPLGLTAPDIAGNQIVLTYQLLSVPATPAGVAGSAGFTSTPPLLGATFDAFDGQSWSQNPHLASVAVSAAASSATPDQTLRARITLRTLPRTEGGSFLLGFDQPLAFSIPAQARLTDGSAPQALNVASWQTTTPLQPGATYTATSTVVSPATLDLPATPGTAPTATPTTAPAAALDPAQAARLEAVPPALQAQLHTLASTWAAGATTPRAQADAVLAGLRAYARLDSAATAPAGSDGVQWFLGQRRGNVLMFTTAYILLGRSIGLPLRLAEGYLPGAYDTGLRQWVVRSSDAAVWAQLAVPGVGWLDLFPAGKTVTLTIPSQVILRDSTPTPTPLPRTAGSSPSTPFTRTTRADQPNTARSILLLGGALLLLALLCVAAFVGWRWSRLGVGLSPLARFFARVAVLARLGGVPLRSSDTAKQATVKVAEHVREQGDTLLTLNTAYERMRYGPPLMRSTLTNLREQWMNVRGPLMRLIVMRPWRRQARVANPRGDARR